MRLPCALALMLICTAASAQAYPQRPIRILVGFPPGGGVDVLGRSIGPKMSESLGQQIVVDNRVGAGGTLASEITARAAPDGYTLVLVSASHAVSASIYKKLGYDAVKDFSAISLVGSSPNVLLGHPETSPRSVPELIKVARANPGALNYASGGIGTTGHLSGELFNMQAGTKIFHIPYKGNPIALTDLIGGRVQLMFTTVPTALPQIQAGRVRALAVTSAKRFVVLPDTPTIAESGLPNYESSNWFGMLAPRNTPAAIITRLNAEIGKALANREVADAILRQGAEPLASTPAQFATYLDAEVTKWAKTIQASGIRVEP